MIDLKATGLMMKKALAENQTSEKGGQTPQLSVSVNDHVSTFIDCSEPTRLDITTKDSLINIRTVVGLHFILK